jgi:hypothetical protein
VLVLGVTQEAAKRKRDIKEKEREKELETGRVSVNQPRRPLLPRHKGRKERVKFKKRP